MEIFGSAFDDSVFEDSRNKVSVALSSYDAKLCEPKWFCGDVAAQEELEQQKILKFRADLSFRQREYEKAMQDYISCLALVPKGNVTIRRDILESQARCYCHLGQQEASLEITDTLRKEATNTGHLTSTLNLLLTIHQRFGNLCEEISALQELISLHPYNPWYWQRLAQGYLSRLLSLSASPETTSCCRGDGPGPAENGRCHLGLHRDHRIHESQEQQDEVWLKATMSFVRTRLLVRLLRIQQSSFVLQRTERAQREADEALQRLGAEETTLCLVSKVMSEDLSPERMREDSQDGESLAGLRAPDVDERWFKKLKQAAVLLKDNRIRGALNTQAPDPD
ncbi:zinc fingers and homeoboxes protein 1-like [Arapaima gigas]